MGSAHLWKTKPGEPSICEETFIDITERKKAEETFQKAFNANPEPIAITTIGEDRYVSVNDSFLRATGYRREDIVGRTSLELGFWGRPEEHWRPATSMTLGGIHGRTHPHEIGSERISTSAHGGRFPDVGRPASDRSSGDPKSQFQGGATHDVFLR